MGFLGVFFWGFFFLAVHTDKAAMVSAVGSQLQDRLGAHDMYVYTYMHTNIRVSIYDIQASCL